MDPVIVASNRGPLSFKLDQEGHPVAIGTAGGLAGTMQPLLRGSGSTWISSSMSEADHVAAERGLMREDGIRLLNVRPTPVLYRQAYDVIANATLWFCLHHLFDLSRRPRFDTRWREAWDGYREFNNQFADLVVQEAAPRSVVLVQDYHLMLTGSMLRQKRPDLRTVFFLHTPFCNPDMLRVLPTDVGGALLDGMAGFGACGFHATRWERCFRQCWDDPELAETTSMPTPRTFVSPIGPVPEAIQQEAQDPATALARAALRDQIDDRKLIVRVDRIELSKNILRGCWAVDELLETRPGWREKFVLLALAYASREGLSDYLAYRSELEHTVERINDRWSTTTWKPIILDVADDRSRSLAALWEYDVLLVNPIRDGLNLVAKEGPLINDNDGVLALSREAGAWDELGEAAIGLNPFDIRGTADAIDAALLMEPDERARRSSELKETIGKRTAAAWFNDLYEVAQSL